MQHFSTQKNLEEKKNTIEKELSRMQRET